MKRLEEIKNEYAKKLEFKDWNDLRSFFILEDIPRLKDFENEVTYLYAKECCKATLHKASENGKIITVNAIHKWKGLDKESIKNESNIVLL
ncbi:hypothetical protein [Chryseobacterium sp.]|uniref:hypothetical protein n=1 Tax=Chryseobacterium sp. TaxID=1871047 RepID=UPI00321ADE77